MVKHFVKCTTKGCWPILCPWISWWYADNADLYILRVKYSITFSIISARKLVISVTEAWNGLIFLRPHQPIHLPQGLLQADWVPGLLAFSMTLPACSGRPVACQVSRRPAIPLDIAVLFASMADCCLSVRSIELGSVTATLSCPPALSTLRETMVVSGVIMTSSTCSCIVLAKHLPIIQNGGNAYPVMLPHFTVKASVCHAPGSSFQLTYFPIWAFSRPANQSTSRGPHRLLIASNMEASTPSCWNQCVCDSESPLPGWTPLRCVLPLTL